MQLHSLIVLLVAASYVVADPPTPSENHPPLFTHSPHAASNNGARPAPYWLEDIKHQGISAFHSNPSSYEVFRNVKDFGAKGMQYSIFSTSVILMKNRRWDY